MRESHVILDFYQANSKTLALVENLKTALVKVLKKFSINIERDLYYQFEPEGVTATLIGPKCQLSTHTWPERGSCTVDFYSSLDKLSVVKLGEELKNSFEAQEYDMRIIRAGN